MSNQINIQNFKHLSLNDRELIRLYLIQEKKEFLESMDKQDIFSIKGKYLNTVYTKYVKKDMEK